MSRELKLIISFIFLSLSFASLYLKAATCPSIDSINRVKGEYIWETTDPGWTGYFIAPKTGKGRSYTVTSFINASWVKSHDLADSSGFVQCDYAGDFVDITQIPNPDYIESTDPNAKQVPKYKEITMHEVIRFVQSNANGAYMPNTAQKSWTCNSIVKFPQEACICYGDVNKCNFKFG